MKYQEKKIVKIINKQSPDELKKWFDEAKDSHEKIWISKGIVNSKHTDTEIYNQAKSYLDEKDVSYKLFPPLVNRAYALCLMGHYEKNEKYFDEHHDIIKYSEGFIGMWKADDENKFGQSTPIGRYTYMFLFDTYQHCMDCAEKLEKAGIGADEMGLSLDPVILKKPMPIYRYEGKFTI